MKNSNRETRDHEQHFGDARGCQGVQVRYTAGLGCDQPARDRVT